MKFIDANNVPYYAPKTILTYDDVLLIPRFSRIESRKDPRINIASKLTAGYSMGCPIISANMDTITEAEMAVTMAKAGGIGILHRFYKDFDKFLSDIERLHKEVGTSAFSIGADPNHLDIVQQVLDKNPQHPPIVCLDVAHADAVKPVNQIKALRKRFGKNIHIIGGNVSTASATLRLIHAGVDAIKVGQGPGSFCTTRIVTGFGVPQLHAIIQCRMAITGAESNIALIADGGIRNSGDIIKAMAAGADSVMIGKLFAGTDECPGDTYYQTPVGDYSKEYLQGDYPTKYKKYRGQSSQDFLNDINKGDMAAEGEMRWMKSKGSVKPILDQLIMGIKSGLSYAGAYNFEQLYNNALFMEITHAARNESMPHGTI